MLLDTHILIWFMYEPDKIPSNIFRKIEQAKVNIFLAQLVFLKLKLKNLLVSWI